jgi:hypothetical protein
MHVLEPLRFFDSCPDGLTLRGRILDHVSDEDSCIKRFVRTPDGTGLAVVRETGGEAWVVRDLGTTLQRAGRWTTADHVVVLNGGKSTWDDGVSFKLTSLYRAHPCNIFGYHLHSYITYLARAHSTPSFYMLPVFTPPSKFCTI